MVAVRWATVALGLVLAALNDEPAGLVLVGLPLVAYAALRTVRPLRHLSQLTGLVAVLGEVLLTLAVVVATGYWDSPYVFTVAAAILAAGFARGFGFALRTALTAAAAIAIPWHLESESARLLTTVQWTGELVLIAVAAGWSRRLFRQAEERTWLSRQANDLLSQLTEVARSLPTSLDLDDTAATTLRQAEQVTGAQAGALLLADAGGTSWSVVAAHGLRLPARVTGSDLPDPLADVVSRTAARLRPATAEPGVVALPLVVRDRLTGVVVLTGVPAATMREASRQALRLLAPAGLALDNARWFARLRMVGADEERGRIARDLHDRLGQSLAFVQFELGRIARLADNPSMSAELERLRSEVSGVVAEVRDTLAELRTDVAADQDLVSTMAAFLDRIAARVPAAIRFHHQVSDRLPLRQEQELWRIGQEAVVNAATHADAATIDISWRCTPAMAELVVSDDGVGLPDGHHLRPGAFGIRGMHERAAAIGAHLTLAEGPSGGTVVRCLLERP